MLLRKGDNNENVKLLQQKLHQAIEKSKKQMGNN